MKHVYPYLLIFSFISLFPSCTKQSSTLFKLLPTDETGITFANQIFDTDTFNILTHEYIYNGGGVGVSDFNNDGLQDLFFTGNLVPNRLYLNKGNLKFEDITEQAGINISGRWNSGVAIADVNKDGWQDIYVCATMLPDSANRKNMLFINNGASNGGIPTFSNQGAAYGVEDGGYSVAAAFFDYDRDGDLDLYVLINQRMDNFPTNYRPKITDGSAPNNDKLYKNNNDGTFTNVTNEAGITIEGFGLGLCISDLNMDGWPDIYVSNDYLSNDVLYINNGNGTFTNRIAEFVGHQSQFSMGNDASDINNDAMPDIITVDMLPETSDRKKTTISNKSYLTYINNEKFKYEYQYVRNMLHLNNGADKQIKFSEVGQLAGVHQTEWSWAPLFADFDNDGNKDLFITNGFPKDITDKDFANYRSIVGNVASLGHLEDSIPVVKIPNYAFRNNGDLTFSNVTKEWGLDMPSFSNGASFVDLDNDGDLEYVVNNINSVASIYENTLYDSDNEKKTANNFVRLKLKDQNNTSGIGANVRLYANGIVQSYENTIYRGFLSSVENAVHFGLGDHEKIDSLIIQWTDGNIQKVDSIRINLTSTIEYKPTSRLRASDSSSAASNVIFINANDVTDIQFKHTEEDKIDFNVQRTLPHKFTQSGPGIAAGDINQDGLEDFIIGGSAKNQAAIFLQSAKGTFVQSKKITLDESKKEEDEGLILFDADGDKDLDLYIVSGSIEYYESKDAYQDRLYLNDGRGKFTLDKAALPDTKSSGSCVRAADYDADGDLDLFVGGRVVPGSYPTAPQSYLLRNEKGKFTDVSSELMPDLANAGMITDAIWSDFNNDNKIDLILAGEFTPVMFFQNVGNKFAKLKTDIDRYVGWWNSITAGDFDSDGDMDYIAGNLGLNNTYQVTEKYPLKVYAKDFDGNGSMDPIITCYMRESMDSDVKRLYPIHFWDELNTQSPKFRNKFSRYRHYGKATIDQVLTPEDLKDAQLFEANHMATSYIRNNGNGKFQISALPVLVQVAPVNGMVTEDVNNDGNLDVVMIGNDFGNEVFAGRYDAFTGIVLIGDGKGNFTLMPSAKSGFYVPGDGKGLVRISSPNKNLFVATQNKDSVKVLSTIKSSSEFEFIPGILDSWGEIVYENGKKHRVEFRYGSGYLSQSSRRYRVPRRAATMTVYDFSGKSRIVDLKNPM